VRINAKPKPFSSPKLAYVGFSSYNFTVWDHIQSTAGDALRKAWGGGCYQNEESARMWRIRQKFLYISTTKKMQKDR
jgi:hypothetical protein